MNPGVLDTFEGKKNSLYSIFISLSKILVLSELEVTQTLGLFCY